MTGDTSSAIVVRQDHDFEPSERRPIGLRCALASVRTRRRGKPQRPHRIGGLLSRDMTGGYGPEEFLLKKALPGKYSVQVQYFGSRQQKAAAPTTIQLELYTRYATGKEEKKEITMRLKDPKQVIDVGEFMFVEGK